MQEPKRYFDAQALTYGAHHGKRSTEQQQNGQEAQKRHLSAKTGIGRCGAPNNHHRGTRAWQVKKRAPLNPPRRVSLPEFRILYADEALLVLDKPAGLLCVPGKGDDKQDCLSNRVQQVYANARVVHRLDMATSGLWVMARGAGAQRSLNDAFANRQIHKRYVAVVDGLLAPPVTDWGVIDLPILPDWPNRPRRIIDAQGKPSITRWRVLQHNPTEQTTRVELEPVTGRSHQLRVHLQALQHAIVGDALYGTQASLAKAGRLLLHATRLEMAHPFSGQSMVFSSVPPF